MELCKATCKTGKSCTYRAKCDGYCGIHHKTAQDCPICLEKTTDIVRITCNHAFHKACIGEWIHRGNRTCPVCRDDITTQTIASIGVFIDSRMETIRMAELYIVGYTSDEMSLLTRYRKMINYDLATVLQAEIICRNQIIEFITKRMKLKIAIKEAEKLKKEVDQITVWLKNTDIEITYVGKTVEEIVKLMITYLKYLQNWDYITS